MQYTARQRNSDTAGFTLIELLVVIAIIGVLVAFFCQQSCKLEAVPVVHCVQITSIIWELPTNNHIGKIGRGMSAFDWRQSILPELENKEEFLLCPDDPRQTMYDVDDFTVYIVNNQTIDSTRTGPLVLDW